MMQNNLITDRYYKQTFRKYLTCKYVQWTIFKNVSTFLIDIQVSQI